MKKQKHKSGKPPQLSLFKKDPRFFGGQILSGKRKCRRPLSTSEPIHFVLRSSWAMGPHSFLRPHNKVHIDTLISSLAKEYGIIIYQRAIASNHLHLLVKIKGRKSYVAFIRVLSSKVALVVMKTKSFKLFLKSLQNLRGDGAKTTEIQGKGQKFWQFRPFCRIVFWGRDFKSCKSYVIQNTLEALGFLAYKARKNSYARWTEESFKTSSA
jgi:REP element-mobilizing transposase RayT